MDITKLKKLTQDNQNDELAKRLTEYPKPPLGVYLQWQVREEEAKEFERSGLVGITLTCYPFKKEGQPASADEKLKVQHTMFFARDADENAGVKEFGGYSSWMDILDGTLAEPRGLGPIPARAFFNQGVPGGVVDGEQVSGDAVEARGKARTSYVRRLQGVLLAELIENNGKLAAPLFKGQAFYAVAGMDKTGKYVNLMNKIGDTWKNFSPTLPRGEEYGF